MWYIELENFLGSENIIIKNSKNYIDGLVGNHLYPLPCSVCSLKNLFYIDKLFIKFVHASKSRLWPLF